MKKFKYFGVVIHPEGGENYDWVNMSKDEIPAILRELSFPTPKGVGITLSNLLVRGDKKPKRSWSIETAPEYYYGKVDQIFGQLEVGETNNRPHYQLWVSMKPQVPRTGMIKELSKKFYNKDNSSCISVLTLSVDNDRMIEYCQKESRANLKGEYEHVQIDNSFSEYQKYLEENPDAKKSKKIRTLINDG